MKEKQHTAAGLRESIETGIDLRDRLWTQLLNAPADEPLSPDRLAQLARYNRALREALATAPALTAARVHVENARCQLCEAFIDRARDAAREVDHA